MSETTNKLRLRDTGIFKLKDRPTRHYQAINLMKQFGFVPEVIIIEKVRGENNKLYVRAVLTPEEIKREDEQAKKIEKLKVIGKEKLHGRSNIKPTTKDTK